MAKNKREIDKEVMFNKIMPSSLLAGTDHTEKEPPAAEKAADEPPKSNSQLFGDSGVQLQNNKNGILVNIMEYLVIDRLDAVFSKFNCCKCDKCKKDVAAIALNKLPPKYVVTDPDKIPELVAKQDSANASTALIQGILQVRSHPRH